MKALEIIDDLERRGFYGKLTLRFVKGHVVSAEKLETFNMGNDPSEEPRRKECQNPPMRLTTR